MGIRRRNIQTYKAKKALIWPAAWEEPIIYHPVQSQLLTDSIRFKVVPAGRRCLAAGTLVATPYGPVKIEDLKIGDIIIGYNEFGQAKITKVTKIWDNGIQTVTPLLSSDKEYVAATEDHKFLACREDGIFKKTKISDIVNGCSLKSAYKNKINVKKGKPRVEKTYDITVDNKTNLYVLHKKGLVTSNSGKTFHAKRNLILEAMKKPGMYFAAAPVRDQAKKIFWKDLGKLIPSWFMEKEPSRTDLVYFLKNASEVHIIGLDKPARIEGQPWIGGVIDEIADCKAETWDEHIRPAFDTIGLDTWAWLIGVPEGLNFYYDLYQYAITAKDPEWKGYTWKSADLLPEKVIDAAKRQLSPRQFQQEYEACFATATGRVYDDYSTKNHTDKVFDPELGDIIWTHDQNFTPMSSAIVQRDKNDVLYVIDEIILNSAVAKQSALEFCERYKDYKKNRVLVYGDASGRIGEKHGHTSDYIEIEQILRKEGFNIQIRIPASNPAIKDGQNSLRAKICNAKEERNLFVNPSKCKYVDKGLGTVQLKKGSTFQEEDSEFQHVTSALRYFTDVEFPVKGKYVPSDQQNWK